MFGPIFSLLSVLKILVSFLKGKSLGLDDNRTVKPFSPAKNSDQEKKSCSLYG